jgi:hypothetical protein
MILPQVGWSFSPFLEKGAGFRHHRSKFIQHHVNSAWIIAIKCRMNFIGVQKQGMQPLNRPQTCGQIWIASTQYLPKLRIAGAKVSVFVPQETKPLVKRWSGCLHRHFQNPVSSP